ncbi:hypothetical protein FACS1894178_1160 [Bacteroidia bacterium]|nr:hypothetical protein FACS1894178_1160 [Bacteroidia bacterium]
MLGYAITGKRQLSDDIFLMDIRQPLLANSAKAGQFLIVIIEENGERIPLTVVDVDKNAETICVVVQAIGTSTKKMAQLKVGDAVFAVVGPLGNPSEFLSENPDDLKQQRYLFVAGGVGAAPVYPQVKWFHENGLKADVIIGARSAENLIMVEDFAKISDNLYLCTDDGSKGFHGNTAQYLDVILSSTEQKFPTPTHIVAIGPMVMMKYVELTAKKHNLPITVSLNPIMIDGTGMCGACRVSVGGKTKFACVEGPEFDGHLVDFDEAIRRLGLYKRFEIGKTNKEHQCQLTDTNAEVPQIRGNFSEVTQTLTLAEAQSEASRCLNCKNAKCVENCPVAVNIPAFVQSVKNGNVAEAAEIIAEDNILPAVCGRVCPQEVQCEGACILARKGKAVAIGKLERFVADNSPVTPNNGKKLSDSSLSSKKLAIIGSGPAGIACAADLAKGGCKVTIFEALHKTGGVLSYGIPEFRLPKAIVRQEINKLMDLGVQIQTNVVVGETLTIDDLFHKHHFDAVFIGSGAGLPKFMNIAGENLNGVFSANEILTRSNLMYAFKDDSTTPIYVGKKCVVVGGGNVAMDAARTALRLGAETHLVYRRTRQEMPARLEEVEHAVLEGVIFHELNNPVEIIGNESGWVSGIKCVKMQLGEPDESGRRSPVVMPNSEFVIDADTVIMALGTSPNPLISKTTDGLETNKWQCITADEDGQTTRKNVFAGGDAVTGAATVILAMGAGRKSAQKIIQSFQ